MARTCLICVHPQRAEIELAIVQQQSQRSIAEEFPDISASSVQRHGDNHLGNDQVRTLVIRGQADDLMASGITTEPSIILQLLTQALALSKHIMEEATDSDRPDLALKAMKEFRDNMSLLYKFTAKVEGPPVDLSAESDLKALSMALRRVLPDHRDAARALVQELKMTGNFSMASAIENVLLIDG